MGKTILLYLFKLLYINIIFCFYFYFYSTVCNILRRLAWWGKDDMFARVQYIVQMNKSLQSNLLNKEFRVNDFCNVSWLRWLFVSFSWLKTGSHSSSFHLSSVVHEVALEEKMSLPVFRFYTSICYQDHVI